MRLLRKAQTYPRQTNDKQIFFHITNPYNTKAKLQILVRLNITMRFLFTKELSKFAL